MSNAPSGPAPARGPGVREGLARPLAGATGLPGEWYSSESLARRESERLFARTWVCAGYAHELERADCAVPGQVAAYPLLFTRNQEGEIKAWHNVCPHRGMRLLDQPHRGAAVIKCPYHAWAFDMDGRLRSTPHWGGYRDHRLDGFDVDRHGLAPVRCEQWHDWLFVNIDGEAPPLAEYMASFEAHLEGYALDRLVHAESVPFGIDGNWKVVEENFLEVLHLPPVHRRLSEYAPFQEHDLVVEGHCLGTVIEKGLPASWSANPLPRHPGMRPDARNAKNLTLFPTFKLMVGPDHCCSMIEFPDGAARTHQRWDFYFVGQDAARNPRYEPARRAIIDFFVELNVEDKTAIAGLQQGRGSPAFSGGLFSPVWEPAVHQFQCLVADYMR